jgi:branched-chain amino acid aminotransferase
MALGDRSATWYEGRWHDGNTPILGSADHGTWQGTLVFDGARAFEGVAPDLELHCARIIASAEAMGLDAPMGAAEIEALIREGIRRLGPDRALYLRPMMWSREGSPAIIDADPGSTAVAICLEDLPMRTPGPMALTVSPFRRPSPDSAICSAKAACHYPNNARIVREARARGFHNALSLDQEGHVAETASSNAFLVRDGVVMTWMEPACWCAPIRRSTRWMISTVGSSPPFRGPVPSTRSAAGPTRTIWKCRCWPIPNIPRRSTPWGRGRSMRWWQISSL